MFVPKFVNHFEEGVTLFNFQDYGIGEDAVAEAVAGGVAFALGGDGALGFCSIGAGGDLFRGSHTATVWGAAPNDGKGLERY